MATCKITIISTVHPHIVSQPKQVIPFVTLLSKLGLNASPLNSVTSSGWPAYRSSELA